MIPIRALAQSIPALFLSMCILQHATAEPPPATALQTIYTEGVPHTNRQGHPRHTYDPENSFLPIGIWGAQLPGKQWDSVSDWQVLVDAGFNTVWPWFCPLKTALSAAEPHDLQIVFMGEIEEDELSLASGHPHLLGNVWHDEPIGKLGPKMEPMFAEYQAYRKRIHAAAPKLPVFINDAPWIMDPATEWWLKWNAEGEISCHDNYPIMNKKHRARSIGAEPNGIPQSVSLGVANVNEQKPQWLIVGAFDQPGEFGENFPFRFPTPAQLRASVYAGIIHGATGIIYFTWDTYVPRDGGVIGMAPDPLPHYVPNPRKEGYTRPTPATPMQLVQSRALWSAATQINTELNELAPAILSPTAPNDVQPTVEIVGEPVTEFPIRVLLKPGKDGGYVMLTVNLDDAMLKVTYTFPRQLKRVATRFENQLPLTLEEGTATFVHSCEPFAVHVFDIKFVE